jgi:hypothetical protein
MNLLITRAVTHGIALIHRWGGLAQMFGKFHPLGLAEFTGNGGHQFRHALVARFVQCPKITQSTGEARRIKYRGGENLHGPLLRSTKLCMVGAPGFECGTNLLPYFPGQGFRQIAGDGKRIWPRGERFGQGEMPEHKPDKQEIKD